MGERSKPVDAYIAKAQPFARPILEHLRDVVHAACPQAIETIKWGMPFFEYKGLLCNMAAFKTHTAFGFWKHGQLVKQGLPGAKLHRDAMGSFGRLSSLSDLPPKRELAALVKAAMKLNDEGTPSPARRDPARKPKPVPPEPAALVAALKRTRGASAAWKAFTPAMRREYLEWIAEAKTDATREKRIATTVEWTAEGKTRNWKYKNC